MSDAHPITLTTAAIDRIQQLVAKKQNQQLKLRIYIIGGGCAGFQYGFKLVETVEADDLTFDYQLTEASETGIQVIIDQMSLMYLAGATVDFKVSLRGAQFTVDNPHAETTCGCGASFSLKLPG